TSPLLAPAAINSLKRAHARFLAVRCTSRLRNRVVWRRRRVRWPFANARLPLPEAQYHSTYDRISGMGCVVDIGHYQCSSILDTSTNEQGRFSDDSSCRNGCSIDAVVRTSTGGRFSGPARKSSGATADPTDA